MNLYQWTDALSASLFALLGIWAAVVRRHWFVRFAVVGGMLALALVVPAYEVVIEFGVAMALIAIAVSAARRPRDWRARWSIETALLAMVVAAVGAAVVGAAPTYGVEQWIRLVGIGITVSYFSLVCLGIVCGRARRGVRIAGGIASITLFVVVMYVGEGILYAASRAAGQPAGSGIFRQSIQTWFKPDYTATWMSAIVPTVAAGVGVLLVVIAAARASGWFTVRDAALPETGTSKLQWLARATLCCGMAMVAAPNIYLLYRLCTPPEQLPELIPADNGYEDFVAAGTLSGVDFVTLRNLALSALSDERLAMLVGEFQPVYDRVDVGLSKEIWARGAYDEPSRLRASEDALLNAMRAMEVRIEYWRRQDRWDEIAELSCRGLQFADECGRGQRLEVDVGSLIELVNWKHLQASIGALSADRCRRLAERLFDLDQRREPIALKVERMRIYQRRSSWTSHLGELIREWSGDGPDSLEESECQIALERLTRRRVLMAVAALQAYWLDHRNLPEKLEVLVPNYLPAVPADATGEGPLRYVRDGAGYRVYGLGRDGADDGGAAVVPGGKATAYDIVAFGPHLPPAPYRVREAVGAAANRMWDFLKAAAAAAEKAARPTSPR